MPIFDTHVVVDWSARSKPSPALPTRDAIFWAVVRDGVAQPVEYARTRADARARLLDLILAERAAGRRVLVGFDFAFGYPAGVAEHLTGQVSGPALWDWIADRVEDSVDNANNRYQVASAVNGTYPGVGPMWGRPASWDFPDVPARAKNRTGDHPCENRATEHFAKGAKTVWQLAYAGAVGSQVILGLPTLKVLRDETGAVVWPFDCGLTVPASDIVIAEIYPSLLQAEAHANKEIDEVLDAAQVRVLAQCFATLDICGELAAFFKPAVSKIDAAASSQEGWILGLGPDLDLRTALKESEAAHASL